MAIMTKPSPSPTAIDPCAPESAHMLPLQMCQDVELLGDERFIRRLFLPHESPRVQDQPQANVTLQSHAGGGGSLRPGVELKLSVTISPSGIERGQTQTVASSGSEGSLASALQKEVAAGKFNESFKMRGLVDGQDNGLLLSRAAASSEGNNQANNGVKNDCSNAYQMPQHKQQQQQQQQLQKSTNDSCEFTFEKVYQRSFLGVDQSFVITKSKKMPNEEIALRIRSGSSGRSEWLNELQVYLIANFRHKNILNCLGAEQTQSLERKTTCWGSVRDKLPRISDVRRSSFLFDSYEEEQAKEVREREESCCSGEGGTIRLRLEYWLLNRFDNCVVLRDFLREHVLEWPQMIRIARGIIEGLHYLHENGDYQDIDKDQAVRGFIKSTNGALKRVVFIDKNTKILMWPPHTCAIIHRNLSSMNIVLKGPEMTPCIWNFGHSKIHHPFQPTNHVNLIDKRLKDVYMSSPYSSPELLQEKAYMTLPAMKSIDMYACGVLFWELLSRCKLPHLIGGFEHEIEERSDPDPYAEPFKREFGPNPCASMLKYAVCRLQARPKLKESWLVGKKSYNFTKTIQDLWDQDYDARVNTYTVMDRLERTDLSDEDIRHDFTPRNSKSFDISTHWPPKVDSAQVPPYFDGFRPNYVFLED